LSLQALPNAAITKEEKIMGKKFLFVMGSDDGGKPV